MSEEADVRRSVLVRLEAVGPQELGELPADAREARSPYGSPGHGTIRPRLVAGAESCPGPGTLPRRRFLAASGQTFATGLS